jgi:lysine 2,3-aminomutase
MKSFRVPDYYKIKACNCPPMKRQFTPDDREDIVLPYEVSDPLDENSHMVSPRLIHRYKDRVLMLVTDKCQLYCRHCFRRDYIDSGSSSINNEEIEKASIYIKAHPEVHEIILSGGDPLTLPIEDLAFLLQSINSIRDNLVIRIGTRVPIVNPIEISDKLIELLQSHGNIWLNLQCNHPKELTEEVRCVLKSFSMAGIHLLNQSVLLKDINDSVDILKKLSHRLLEFGVKPYYIFQGDLAKGTSHLRVPITKGLEIMSQLRNELSGLAMPLYAVDIPGGGGKIPLNRDYITGEDDEYYYLTNREGFNGKYPKEERL